MEICTESASSKCSSPCICTKCPKPIYYFVSGADSKWFSVIDLANAFFSIPVQPNSQYWFTFSFKGKNYK